MTITVLIIIIIPTELEDYEKKLEMSTNAMAVSQTRFKVGWIILMKDFFSRQ
jgi:hypothetical protein